MQRIYTHKNTGRLYLVEAEAIDCTNERDGTPVVVYRRVGEHQTYVRLRSEFTEQFEPTMCSDDLIPQPSTDEDEHWIVPSATLLPLLESLRNSKR
jgi:hypothetical protein